jgi:hypothetical protein
MHQHDALAAEHARVLAHLERVFPAACTAEDVAADLGLSVSGALAALEALRRRGDLRFGPGAPDGTPAPAVYEAVRAPRPPAAKAADDARAP